MKQAGVEAVEWWEVDLRCRVGIKKYITYCNVYIILNPDFDPKFTVTNPLPLQIKPRRYHVDDKTVTNSASEYAVKR